MESASSVEVIGEFINPRHIPVTNLHLLVMLDLFAIISLADVMTTASCLVFGGVECNLVLDSLLSLYGLPIVFWFKVAVIGAITCTIGILWKWRGVHPTRFFWALTSITLATIWVVFWNLSVIFTLLHG
jgi:hypothetical protein